MNDETIDKILKKVIRDLCSWHSCDVVRAPTSEDELRHAVLLGYEQGKSEVLKELSKLKAEVIPRIVNADWIKTKFDVGHCYESEIINELFRKFDYNNYGDGNIEKQSLTSQPQSQDSSSVGNVPTNEGSNIPSNIHPDTQTPQNNSQSPTSDCSKLAGESLRAKEQEADE